jgi:uncharacterized protein YhfF
MADEGAAAILDATKTATSSAQWDYPGGRIPFVGALSVLLDGQGRARGIVETVRVEIMPFGLVDDEFARAYGEGDRTLGWWRAEVGAWYRVAAASHGQDFSDSTPIICEWLTVVRRLWPRARRSGKAIEDPPKIRSASICEVTERRGRVRSRAA